MATAGMSQPLLCRLGLHRFDAYDAAWFSRVRVCSRCNQPQSQQEADKLALERELWGEVSSVYTEVNDAEMQRHLRLSWVYSHLNDIPMRGRRPRPV